MFRSTRVSRLFIRTSIAAISLSGVFIACGVTAAQSTPQLLPYTSKLIAGGGSTPAIAGSACSRAGAAPSGNKSTDAYGDGCLATEITLTAPRAAVVDRTGAIFFTDYTNALVRRVDPNTGIVTAVAGGASATPSGTAAAPVSCGSTDTHSSVDVLGDGCLGTSVKLGHPAYLVFSPAGDLYFSDPYDYNVRKIAATNGVITTTGVISTAMGSYGGTSLTAKGYTAGCNTTSTSTTTGCLLYAPNGLSFDNQGDLLVSEEYLDAVLAVNTNTTGSTTVLGVSVPAQTAVKVTGSRASGAACTNGASSSYGCSYGSYSNGAAATASELDSNYAIALDPAGNLYIGDEYFSNVATVSNTAYTINSYAGIYPLNAVGSMQAATVRATAGTFAIGSDFGVAADQSLNVYVTDALNGYIWRVDAANKSMYVVGGGGATASTAGSPCPNAANFTATDTAGDGCPGTVATFSKSNNGCKTTCYASTGVYGISADVYGDVFVGDEGNNLVRELASGTQFGAIGASQTDYVDVHFAAGDGPLKSGGFAITSGQGIFTIGTPTSTVNSDNTTDYIVPITATPSATGPFTGTLTVYSNQVPAGTPFTLTGTFVQSPVTRTVVSASSSLNCSGTSYATTTAVTLTASLVANGPSAPSGTITFFSNGTQIGSPQPVTNLGTASAPTYGATLTNTFSTAGNYSITATFTPTAGTYFAGSTSAPVVITSTTPTFTATATPYQESTVKAGGTALYSFTLNQTLYTGTITFACSGLPANSSCSFSPQTITATGCSTTNTVALSILTTQAVTTVPGSIVPGGRWTLLTSISGLALLVLFGMRRKGSAMRFGRIGFLCGLLLALTAMTACGKGTQGPAATPTGTSTVTVTATGSTGVTSSFNVQLTVQ